MMTYLEFLKEYPESSLLTQIIYPPERGFSTYICFHNYYERVLKKTIDCSIHAFVLDKNGKQIEYINKTVSSDSAVQILAGSKLEGMGLVAVGLVPQTDLEILRTQGVPVKKRQLAGFYMLWTNTENGVIDTSHEWWEVYQTPTPHESFFINFPKDPYITKRGLFIYNPHATEPASAALNIGNNVEYINLAPLQCSEINFLDGVDKVSVNPVSKQNFIAAPLTIEYHQSGDVHIHHA